MLCAAVLFSQSLGTQLFFSEKALSKSVGQASGLFEGRTEYLSGINGETFGFGIDHAAAQDQIIDQDGVDASPAAWGELSERRCLTLTAKNGETFSFRIRGVRAEPGEHAGQSEPEIELAISPCTNNGNAIEKAVIESDKSKPEKNPTSEHSL